MCVCACVRAVSWELKFYILFTPISSLTIRIHVFEPWTASYKWVSMGKFRRPANTRPWFSAVFLSHRNVAQLVHEVPLALRSPHAAFAVTVTKFYWIQRSITVKHSSLISVIFATCFSSRNHHRAFRYKYFKHISIFALWIVPLCLLFGL